MGSKSKLAGEGPPPMTWRNS